MDKPCPRCNGQKYTTHVHVRHAMPANSLYRYQMVTLPCDVCGGAGFPQLGQKRGWDAIVDVLQKAGLD